MAVRIAQIRISLESNEADAVRMALAKARIDEAEVASIEVARLSVDRRRRRGQSGPTMVYTFDLHLKDGLDHKRFLSHRDKDVTWTESPILPALKHGELELDSRPVVVGTGPAGLFAALVLAREGYRPLLIERGSRMNRRVGQIRDFNRKRLLNPESNYLFGEGGAGTFSDGKLTSRSKDPRSKLVMEEFRQLSGMPAVGYHYRPHLGSDRVRAVVGRLRREIERLGGEFRFDECVKGFDIRESKLCGVRTSREELAAQALICAPGHSARDFYQTLLDEGLPLEQKPFQFGFRVEHPQDFVDACIYGAAQGRQGLAPADYRLVANTKHCDIFSFCMCPGGEIIAAMHDPNHFCTNGMSDYARATGFANSGLVATIPCEKFADSHPLAGMDLQQRYESRAAEAAGADFALPSQKLQDFMTGYVSSELTASSYQGPLRAHDLGSLAPDWVVSGLIEAIERFEHQMPGFLSPQAQLCGPESRSSAPVRILRDRETMATPGVRGFYPVGEGAGYAGGIVSAAVDGWRAAEALIQRFAAPKS